MIISNVLFKLHLKFASPQKKAQLYAKKYHVSMGKNCICFGKVDFGSEPYLIKFGNQVMLSDGVSFSTHDGGMLVLHNNGWLTNSDVFGEIYVGNNVFVGRNATILKGITIGNNVIIGAGSIVTKNCEDNAVYAGIPAKKIKTLDEYYEKVKDIADFTLNYTAEEKKQYLLLKYKKEV